MQIQMVGKSSTIYIHSDISQPKKILEMTTPMMKSVLMMSSAQISTNTAKIVPMTSSLMMTMIPNNITSVLVDCLP